MVKTIRVAINLEVYTVAILELFIPELKNIAIAHF